MIESKTYNANTWGYASSIDVKYDGYNLLSVVSCYASDTVLDITGYVSNSSNQLIAIIYRNMYDKNITATITVQLLYITS